MQYELNEIKKREEKIRKWRITANKCFTIEAACTINKMIERQYMIIAKLEIEVERQKKEALEQERRVAYAQSLQNMALGQQQQQWGLSCQQNGSLWGKNVLD